MAATAPGTSGIHHITAICGEPRANVAFYRDALGLRLVKKTVNHDDPSAWHLYYGDPMGNPGTAMTFFPWPMAAKGRPGRGQAVETRFAVPTGALSGWERRLRELGIAFERTDRFGEAVLVFADPDGAPVAVVETEVGTRPLWTQPSTLPAPLAIFGFAGITLHSRAPEQTAAVLRAMGYGEAATDGPIQRFSTGADGLAPVIDLDAAPEQAPGANGRGSIHHVAFRASDDAAQGAMVEQLTALGMRVTEQVDRTYFRSVYFREPGGILFEIATDGPGFTADEPLAQLGESLVLPPRLEPHRAAIAANLAPL